jgi:ABC-type transport system substrate-binding protein
MTAVTALRAGEGHTQWEVPIEHVDRLKKDGFDIHHYPGAMRALTWDSGNPDSPYADKRVREAVEYAIDRKGITDGLSYNFWEPLFQYSSKKSNGYDPGLKGRPHNPEKARQLLKEAGYPNGFKTSLIGNSRGRQGDFYAAMQRDLQKVGIDVEVTFMDAGKYWFTILKGWKNGLIVYAQNAPINLSMQLDGLFKKNAARFPCMLRPLELQEVLTKAQKTTDDDIQRSLVKKGVRMISDKAVVVPLWTWSIINATHKTLHDTGYSATNRGQWEPANAWLSK